MIRKWLFIIAFLMPLACAAPGKEKPSSGFIGTISPTNEIIVDQVFADSPAKLGGLKSGDRIIKVNGGTVISHKEFCEDLEWIPEGRDGIFTVLRNNRKIEMTIIPRRGNYRFGFSYKASDPEIAQQLIFEIRPENVDQISKK